jgi:hypothetical protein
MANTVDDLTPRQARGLLAVRAYHRAHGHAPSREDIGRMLKPAAPKPENVVRGLFERLQLQGLIVLTPRVGRSMRLTAQGELVTAELERRYGPDAFERIRLGFPDAEPAEPTTTPAPI